MLRLAERRGRGSNPHHHEGDNDRPIGPFPGKLPAIEVLCQLSDPAFGKSKWTRTQTTSSANKKTLQGAINSKLITLMLRLAE